MELVIWVLLLGGTGVVLVLAPRFGLAAQWRRWSALRERARIEDALKHLHTLSQRGQTGNAESLAGALHLSQPELVRLIEKMETRGMLQTTSGAFQLTAGGERLAVQIVRAHRLWERYLADEAGVPLNRLHPVAEKAEHALTADRLDQLDAHLGHPLHDPHGDPIPRPDGSLETLDAVPLTDWPTGDKARIVHVEDEPDVVLQQILALGLSPGSRLRILESHPDYLLVSDGELEHRLAPVVAANIHVQPAPSMARRPADLVSLSELRDGEQAEVVDIDSEYRGFGRRRLLDLGLTPTAKVRAQLATAFGDPRAYLVRGTVIALRGDQAKHIWVRRAESAQAAVAG